MGSVLITGGLGFVGGRLSKKIASGSDVLVSSRTIADKKALAAHGNVRQIDHAELLLKDSFPHKTDTVIHLAALNEWDCVRHPSDAIRVNVDETRIILENAIASGVQHFIYFSTAHIYASPLKGHIDETALPVPVHPYAITHKAAEDYVVAAGLQNKIHAIVVRLSNSFGAPVVPTVNRWTLLANDLARQAIEKGRLTLNSNGCQFRDFITLTDVENAIHGMLAGISGFNKMIYNLGAGKSLKVIEMAEMLAAAYKELFGNSLEIKLPDNSIPTKEPELVFSNERLISEGIVIKNDWMSELKELLLFCHQNFKPAALAQ